MESCWLLHVERGAEGYFVDKLNSVGLFFISHEGTKTPRIFVVSDTGSEKITYFVSS